MKIAVEIDLKKIGTLAAMAICTWLSIKIGCADALVLVIPAGIATLLERG